MFFNFSVLIKEFLHLKWFKLKHELVIKDRIMKEIKNLLLCISFNYFKLSLFPFMLNLQIVQTWWRFIIINLTMGQQISKICCNIEDEQHNIRFDAIIGSYYLDFCFEYNYNMLTIKAYSQANIAIQSLVYHAAYDDRGLPLNLYEIFGSVENLTKQLQKLKSDKNKMLIDSDGNLLVSQIQLSEDIVVISLGPKLENDNNFHSIKPVQENLLNNLPYSAVVKIVSNFNVGHKTSSGFLVKQQDQIFVRTAAHNLCQQSQQVKQQNVSVFVQTNNGLKQVKNNKVVFQKTYLGTNKTEMFRFDQVRIYLNENFHVRDQVLMLKQQKIMFSSSSIEVIFFSPYLDRIHDKKNTCYHLKSQNISSLFQGQFTYKTRASPGITGGVVVGQQYGIFKVLGFHQAAIGSQSQCVFLSKYIVKKDPINKQIQLSSKQLKLRQKKIKDYDRICLEILKKGLQFFQQANRLFGLHFTNQFYQKLQTENQNLQYTYGIHRLALIQFFKKNYDESLKLNEQCLKIFQEKIGKLSMEYTRTLKTIARIYQVKGDLHKASSLVKQLTQLQNINQKQYFKKQFNKYQFYGLLYNDKGIHLAQQSRYKKHSQIYEITVGKNSFSYASNLNNLGVTYQDLGQHKKSLESYQQCIQILIKTGNQNHPYFKTYKTNFQRMKTKLYPNDLQ